ncbi:hypothetical protein FHS91_003427 [Sphingobium xanthum]
MGIALTPTRHAELVSASIRTCRRKPKADREIDPFRIVTLNQVDLPLPVPALELFLAQDRTFHGAEEFVADEMVNAMSAREAGDRAGTVLVKPANKVRCNADIQRSMARACKDVDAGLLFHSGSEGAARWMLKQVQHDDFEDKHRPKTNVILNSFQDPFRPAAAMEDRRP